MGGSGWGWGVRVDVNEELKFWQELHVRLHEIIAFLYIHPVST